MQADAKVLDFLNQALTNELTAINQYWLHYRVLHHWGVRKLAEYERHESIDEMKHADMLADRILFLDGLPNFQAINKLKVGESVEEILPRSWKRLEDAVKCDTLQGNYPPWGADRCTTRNSHPPSQASLRTSSRSSAEPFQLITMIRCQIVLR